MPALFRRGLVLLIGLVVGCAHGPGSMGETAVTEFECGPAKVSVTPNPEGLTLELLGESYSLVRAASASGARYVAEGGGNTEFLQENDLAQLTLAGHAWPQCVATGALPQPFRARGNEPFWQLTIEDGDLSFNTLGAPEERRWELVPLDHLSKGSVYGDATGVLQFQATRDLCRDTMTGMPYPWRVDLKLDEQALSGCGGSANELLQGPVWHPTSLQGRAINPDLGVTLMFLQEQRLAGHSGCNRYGGGYQLSGESLTIGELFSTRMACMDPERSRMEADFLALLKKVDRFDLNDRDGTLELWGGDQLLLQAEPGVP